MNRTLRNDDRLAERVEMRSVELQRLAAGGTYRSKSRRAAAAMMIVFTLLVLIITSVQLNIRYSAVQRRDAARRDRIDQLDSAIQCVERSAAELPVTLPIDAETKQKIEVSIATEDDFWVAKWYRGPTIVETITRPRSEKEATESK